MNCEQVRAQLLELDSSEFDSIAHLDECAQCQAFAQRIVEAEAAVTQHVEGFATEGTFEDEWAAARRTSAPNRPWFVWSGWPALALAALALLVALPVGLSALDAAPQRVSPDVAVPVVADPGPAPAVAPAPATEPDPAEPDPPPTVTPIVPSPRPRPRAAPRPRPPAPAASPLPPDPTPEPEEPAQLSPSVDPEQHAPPVVAVDDPTTGTLVLVVDDSFTSGTVQCPSGFVGQVQVRSGRTRLPEVPTESCTLTMEPGAVSGVVRGGGRYRVTPGGVVED